MIRKTCTTCGQKNVAHGSYGPHLAHASGKRHQAALLAVAERTSEAPPPRPARLCLHRSDPYECSVCVAGFRLLLATKRMARAASLAGWGDGKDDLRRRADTFHARPRPQCRAPARCGVKGLSEEQAARFHDLTAGAIRNVIAAAEGHAQDAAIISGVWMTPEGHDASGAASMAVIELRMTLAGYVVHGRDPLKALRDAAIAARARGARCADAYGQAAEDLADRLYERGVSMKLRERVDGAPYQCGDRVRVVDAIDRHVSDLSTHIGRAGVVTWLHYEDLGQTYPGDPTIGVQLDGGPDETFWREELAPEGARGAA